MSGDYVFVGDESFKVETRQAYEEFFSAAPYPARATLIAGIAAGCRIEIDVVAMRGREPRDADMRRFAHESEQWLSGCSFNTLPMVTEKYRRLHCETD